MHRKEIGILELSDILKQVNEVFVEILDDATIVLNATTTANDIEEWDSLSHIQIIVAIEKYFNIRFSSQEIKKFKNVGEMCDAILRRLSQLNTGTG
jgi:acyl carrier protein